MIGVCGHHAEHPEARCGRCSAAHIRVPVRHDGPFCPTCGMDEGHHWNGCKETAR